jgi:hypothetical protein
MPDIDPDEADDGTPPKLGTWRRFRENPDDESFAARVKDLMLKPVVAAETGPDSRPQVAEPTTVEEIEAAIARADDKERMVALFAAPLAGLIGLIVTASLINNDPKARLANGAINTHHTNPTLYLEIGGTAFVLALLMLGLAWWRKRLYLGIVMALYGLTIFNLKFWGFGIPYLLAAAWYLVRHYRLTQKLKLATAGGGGGTAGRPSPGGPNKRYTPPTGR